MDHGFEAMWADLEPIGRDRRGGYRRFAWTGPDAQLREWFVAEARRRDLDTTLDRAGNLWAWWGDPDAAVAAGDPGVVAGSHLDSVPSGGAFDGPLGVVSAFAALDILRGQDHTPARPIGVACFADEEGARFGVACAGSRVITGALDADRALALTDRDGVSLAEALRRHGRDPRDLGPDRDTLRRVGTFVELHVEQGRGLVDLGRPVGVATSIWPHGRWRVTLTGEANHAGTTPLPDRVDPMLDLAGLITGAREAAERHGVLATVGRIEVDPNGVNAIASQVRAWLDCRGADEDAVRSVLADLAPYGPQSESWTPATRFDPRLAHRLSTRLEDAPLLATGAGHDAGILSAAGIPTTMLFVRNPTGVSHSPAEHADSDDCLAGVDALAAVLTELTR
ncbi:allantoate amidohydrolase [Jiangella asiatica]|uniref:Allantoate amidohydrolase n=1 Tax=Jiangella asiatica TaxID=2530372 RepID=A0A4R5DQS5_9ACTN|nr:allantoate amidohydrolase [Jiangella asiatica]TDE16027.1 allantoate amidohydrolase [Jiangella asiatica]